ncbi:MAG: hypothetical protein WDO19_19590 [Bacteroidota bacterium]
MPAIKQTGLAMQVIPEGDKRILSINSTADAAKSLGVITVIGTMYQNIVFKVSENAAKGLIQKTVPTQNLPTGILTITVFDEQWNPVAERITYINNKEYLFQPNLK